MDLYGVGFSNIRFASDDTNYVYNYNVRVNNFSEEVFMHEFIHTLERTSQEYGYHTITLHDYEKYGYKEEGVLGLKSWYKDYLRHNILDKNTNEYVGLNENVYTLKPINEDNFNFALEVEFNEEPQNLFEEVKCLFDVVTDAL